MNSTANDTQVAGTHYKTAIQHWDFVVARKHNYIESQVSKYVTRWYKKDGLKDLRKALHFTQKLQELAPIFAREDQWWRNVLRWARAHTKAPLNPPCVGAVTVAEYVEANGLAQQGPEHQVIEAIDDWVRGGRTNPERLRDAEWALAALIDRLEGTPKQKQPQATSEADAAPTPAPAPEIVTLQQSAQQADNSGAEAGAGYVDQDRPVSGGGGDFAGGGASDSWDSGSDGSSSGGGSSAD